MSKAEWDKLAYPRGPKGVYVQPGRRLLGAGGQPKARTKPNEQVHKVHPYVWGTRYPPQVSDAMVSKGGGAAY
eukprot:1181694-Prorocentrum_minimum.AAC.1